MRCGWHLWIWRNRRIQILRGFGGFKSMDERMKEDNGLIEMVKYAEERSGSRDGHELV